MKEVSVLKTENTSEFDVLLPVAQAEAEQILAFFASKVPKGRGADADANSAQLGNVLSASSSYYFRNLTISGTLRVQRPVGTGVDPTRIFVKESLRFEPGSKIETEHDLVIHAGVCEGEHVVIEGRRNRQGDDGHSYSRHARADDGASGANTGASGKRGEDAELIGRQGGFGERGGKGDDGQDGADGRNGGNGGDGETNAAIELLVGEFSQFSIVTVTSNGGVGGHGGDGESGGHGGDGRKGGQGGKGGAASLTHRPGRGGDGGPGGAAGSGGDGGRGGRGGDGGDGGDIRLYMLNPIGFPLSSALTSEPGAPGSHGTSGDPGRAGTPGEGGLWGPGGEASLTHNRGKTGVTGPAGAAGDPGLKLSPRPDGRWGERGLTDGPRVVRSIEALQALSPFHPGDGGTLLDEIVKHLGGK